MEEVRECVSERLQTLSLGDELLDGDRMQSKEALLEVFTLLKDLKEGLDAMRIELDRLKADQNTANQLRELMNVSEERIRTCKENIPSGARKISSNVLKERNSNEVISNNSDDKENNLKKAELYRSFQHLTQKEFESIPKYMKGRVQYDTLGCAVSEMNGALESKYTFLGRTFANMTSLSDKKRYKLLKAQETKGTKGIQFIAAEDLKDSALLKSETNRRNLITILRHFKKVREIRGPGSIVRYVPM